MDAQSLKAQIDSGVDQLKNNLSSLLRIDDGLQKRILQLEHDLNVHQLALAGLKVEHARLLKLEESVQGFRVVVLIDGDGTIFTHDLVAQGREGGDKAARLLSETITRFLDDTYGRNPYQVGVYIFCNKRGLSNVLGVADNIFDEFIVGLQQASPRFLVSDVGGGKEMADAKIKAQLQDNITLPQTFKIIFGGCHDSGYISELRAHITAGYRDKLILLKGCSMAKEIAALDLPAFGNPELFRTQKIVSIPLSRSAFPPNQFGAQDNDGEGANGTSSYSAALQRASPRENGGRDRSPSSTEGSFDTTYQGAGTRHINPQLPLSKQKPPPCSLFYLSNCKLGSNCKYGHEYLLNAEQYEELRRNARLGPCPMINRGEPICVWGDNCIYGHTCPHLGRCPFMKLGKCKFQGSDMHNDPAGS